MIIKCYCNFGNYIIDMSNVEISFIIKPGYVNLDVILMYLAIYAFDLLDIISYLDLYTAT